jgi:hypothetical protein
MARSCKEGAYNISMFHTSLIASWTSCYNHRQRDSVQPCLGSCRSGVVDGILLGKIYSHQTAKTTDSRTAETIQNDV